MSDIIVVGNPNAGKTTFINSLCNSNDKVGNWHGVTVKEAVHKTNILGKELMVVDLPGLYSLSASSPEEVVAKEYIVSHKDDLIVNIIDANYLERSLILTFELLKLSSHVVVAINMAGEVKNIDFDLLAEHLGIEVVPVDARKKKDVTKFICEIINEPQKTPSKIINNLSNDYVRSSQEIVRLCKKEVVSNKKPLFLSNILLNKYAFLPIFLSVMLIVFFIAFGPVGLVLSSGFQYVVQKLFDIIFGRILAEKIVLYEFLSGGVFGAIKSVISFIPQIALLNFCIGFLENSGYLPRVAYMFNSLLSQIGLNGKSTLALLLGLGCSASAVTFTSSIENKSVQKKTAIMLGFIPCSAKMPFVLCVCSTFFPKYKFACVFALYLLSILTGIAVLKLIGLIQRKKKEYNDYFLLEIPKMRIPSMWLIIKLSLRAAFDFFARIMGTVTIGSIIIYLLSSFTFNFTYVGMLSDGNMLTAISNFLFPIMKLFGLSSGYDVVVLLSGLFGKEMIVSSIGELNGVGSLGITLGESLTLVSSPVHFLSLKSIVVFSVIMVLYPTCITAFAGFKAKLGTKFAVFSFFVNLVSAFLMAFVVNLLFSCSISLVLLLCCILIAIISFIVLKYKKVNKCKGNCYGCNKLCW